MWYTLSDRHECSQGIAITVLAFSEQYIASKKNVACGMHEEAAYVDLYSVEGLHNNDKVCRHQW